MAHSHYHAKSSARKFGGIPEDYYAIHNWFDATKSAFAKVQHRAVLHNTFGIFLAEELFGVQEENRQLRARLAALGESLPTPRPTTITRESDGVQVAIRLVAEQHVKEDCGFIPTLQDWLEEVPMEDWMILGARPLSRELKEPAKGEPAWGG